MIQAVLVGGDKLKEWLKTRKENLEVSTVRTMTMLVIKLTRKIKEEKLSGQVLKNRTGRLRRSISPDVRVGHDDIVGKVSTNVVYAAIHEYGGTINHPGSRPKNGLALRWLNPGFQGPLRTGRSGKVIKSETASAFVFAKSTKPHKIVMPERSFMRSAQAEMQPEIHEAFHDAFTEVLRT